MKNLVSSMFVIGALATSVGCVIEDSDDPYGDFEVSWAFVSADAPCNLIASIDINARPAGTADTPFTATYDTCASGLLSVELGLGQWEVWAAYYDASDTLLAQSDAVTATLEADLVTVPINLGDVPFDTGAFSLAWTVNGAAASPTSCNGINSMNVHIQGVDGNSVEQTMEFACIDGVGETGQWPLGQYEVIIDALDEFGASVITPVQVLDPVTDDNPVLGWGNQLFELVQVDLAPL